MSYLTLLFPSQAQGMVKNAEAEQEVFGRTDACEKAWTRAGEGPDDFMLPSGIVSMEHWLDLNA